MELVFILCSNAQNNIGQITLRGHYGYVMPHTNIITHLTNNRHIGIFELEYNVQTDGSAIWQAAYKKPRVGTSLLFAGLNNPNVLGYAIATHYHVDIPIIQSKNTVFSGRIGAGLSFITKRFDLKHNPKNTAIGSHINCTIAGNLNLKQSLKKSYYLEGGVAITHFSNALFRPPNLGLNLITTHMGITKNILKYKCSCEKQNKKTTLYNKKKWGFAVDAAMAAKSIYPGDKNLYAAYNVSTQVHARLSNISKLKTGIELFHDNTLIKEMQRQQLFIGQEERVAKHVGIYLGHELWFSRIAVLFRSGYYVYDKWQKHGKIYQKYGIRYQFHKHVYLYVQVKTHFANADYALWGVGVNL
ncbi:MAG: acyloxyacyl hydrolase [Bacteroidia bacterium]|nr:acyloxyacyl hydrolase [Bacteroidia bacterium]MDW8347368.1 acyloxyacyl hydrolase [Bacteroidia bacterium]